MWNCRGLGNPRAVRALKELVQSKDPHVVFICETKLHVNKLDKIKRICKMNAVVGVSSAGSSGGLAMLWNDNVQLVLKSFSVNHIDVIVEQRGNEEPWHFTSFYGEPDANKRNESWRLLRELARQDNKPWMCMGDFNEIL